MRVVHDKLSAIEPILSNTTILPIGKHVLECVTSTSLALTGPIVSTSNVDYKKNAIIIILVPIWQSDLASADIILEDKQIQQTIFDTCAFM